ncbi:hypothetical protein K503DRAFT_814208, partial [Rhizopogon vinicolor AM-OR11-026]
RGEDVERQKNWEWTIEENENWEKKKTRKARRADYEFHDDAHAARRRYKKDLDLIKPDLAAYSRQKDVVVTSTEQRMAAESFYRDANTLLYADNKPTEDAIDRVVGKIDRKYVVILRPIDKKEKFSRKRLNEDEGDITYINERNHASEVASAKGKQKMCKSHSGGRGSTSR